jgi:hypothetical protein
MFPSLSLTFYLAGDETTEHGMGGEDKCHPTRNIALKNRKRTKYSEINPFVEILEVGWIFVKNG